MKQNTKNFNSNYWIAPVIHRDIFKKSQNNDDIIKVIYLSRIKQAVKNFVKILTGKEFDVFFDTRADQSYTAHSRENKKYHIVLNADIKKQKDIDVAVGLALHEASHILLSDFDFLYTMEFCFTPTELTGILNNTFAKIIGNVELANKMKSYYNNCLSNYYGALTRKRFIKNIINFIEDRRVDHYVMTNVPGYKNYYEDLYNKHFRHHSLNKIISTNQIANEKTLKDYTFRIINLYHPLANMHALPYLQIIKNLIDVKNIDRLKNTRDSAIIAKQISAIVFYVIDINKQTNNNDDQLANQNYNSYKVNNKKTIKKDKPLTDKQRKTFKQNIDIVNKKQEKFNSGDINKHTVKYDVAKIINNINNNDLSVITTKIKIPIIQLNNINKNMIINGQYKQMGIDCFIDNINNKDLSKYQQQVTHYAVQRGVVRGRKLLKKIKITNERNNLQNHHLSAGRLDTKILHQLVTDNENIFYRNNRQNKKNFNLHISIDASGSMGSYIDYEDAPRTVKNKWSSTIETLISILYVATSIDNIEATVDFRCTTRFAKPLLIKAFDTTKHSLQYIKDIITYIRPAGETPEGLIFEHFAEKSNNCNYNDKYYFINISDGMPSLNFSLANGKRIYYSANSQYSYGKNIISGIMHTKQQIQKLKQKNIKIISYFLFDQQENATMLRDTTMVNKIFREIKKEAQINKDIFISRDKTHEILKRIQNEKKTNSYNNNNCSYLNLTLQTMRNFIEMYGIRDSHYINLDSIYEMAKTLNEAFIK